MNRNTEKPRVKRKQGTRRTKSAYERYLIAHAKMAEYLGVSQDYLSSLINIGPDNGQDWAVLERMFDFLREHSSIDKEKLSYWRANLKIRYLTNELRPRIWFRHIHVAN